MNTTPGCSVSRLTTLRARKGRAFTSFSLNGFPTVASEVLSIGTASASTVTVSESDPSSRRTFRVVRVDTSTSTGSRTKVLKPCRDTRTL